MMMSQSTTSGRTSWTFSTARRPLPTVTTSKSSSENVSSMTFWIVMLSSASSIFLPIACCPPHGESGGSPAPDRHIKIDRSCLYVKDLSGLAPRSADGKGGLDQADDVLGGGAGQEPLRHSHRLQEGDVLGGDDSPQEHPDPPAPLGPEELQNALADLEMGPGQDREADRIHVLLRSRGHDLLRALAEAGVDDFHPRIAEGAGYHLGSPVMAVQAGLGDEDPDLARSRTGGRRLLVWHRHH